MFHTICSEPELRSALRKRAASYFSQEADQDELINRTVSAVCDDPGLIDDQPIQPALFAVMHHLAQSECCRPEARENLAAA